MISATSLLIHAMFVFDLPDVCCFSFDAVDAFSFCMSSTIPVAT